MGVKVSQQFTKVPNYLLRSNCSLTFNERMLFIYILSHERCFASQERIGQDMGLSRSTVQRAVKSLLKRNAIGKIGLGGYAVQYVCKPRSEWADVTVGVGCE